MHEFSMTSLRRVALEVGGCELKKSTCGEGNMMQMQMGMGMGKWRRRFWGSYMIPSVSTWRILVEWVDVHEQCDVSI